MVWLKEMGTVLISSTSKKNRFQRRASALLFFALTLTYSSCSSGPEPRVLSPKEEQAIKDSLGSLKSLETPKNLVKLNPGPSKKSVSFVESKANYGLGPLVATNLSLGDLDGDGHLDLISAPFILGPPEFWRFNPKLKKFEKMAELPLSSIPRAHFYAIEDLDRDGVNDIIVGMMNQKSELSSKPITFYQGIKRAEGVFFQEVPDFFPSDILATSSISMNDIDLDGKLDLFVSNWFDSKGTGKHERDRVYHQRDGKFVNISQVLEGENEYRRDQEIYPNAVPSIGVSSCDVDQNGFADFLTTSTSGFSNKMWLNLSDSSNGFRRLRDYGAESGFASDIDGKFDIRGGGNSFAAGCVDYNNNGFLDIFLGELSHSHDQSIRDRSSFLTNTGKGFPPSFLRTEYDRALPAQSWSQLDRRVVFADFNLDGLVDMLVENTGFPPATRLLLFKQESDHSFTEVGAEWGIDIVNPSSVVVSDINNDGKPDILVGQNSLRTDEFKENFYLFINQLDTGKNRGLKIYLQGRSANPSARGSLVKVVTSESTQTRWYDNFSGMMPAQESDYLIFGLGTQRAQSIEVTWPYLPKQARRPAPKKYDLKKFKLSAHQTLTLCESGPILLGKKKCP